MDKSALTSSVEKNQQPSVQKHQHNETQYVFYLDLPHTESPLKQVLMLTSELLVSQALQRALVAFNSQLASKNKYLQMNIDYYSPRLAKKNGKPKTDMPCVQLEQKIGHIKIKTISIQIKNFNAIKAKQKQDTVMTPVNQPYRQTINVQIGKAKAKGQLEEEQQIVQKEKKSDCFLSFC